MELKTEKQIRAKEIGDSQLFVQIKMPMSDEEYKSRSGIKSGLKNNEYGNKILY